jgi:hypothetical protein
MTASRWLAVGVLAACAALAPLACLPDYQLGASPGSGGADAGNGGGGGSASGGDGGMASGGSGGGASASTTTGSGGAAGSGGECGGWETGAGGDSPNCQGCGDVICTGQPVSKLCESSRILYSELAQCACCGACADACAENACPPSAANHDAACAQCVQASCNGPYAACLADPNAGAYNPALCW